MNWTDAYKQIDRPSYTNRDASGVIGFARALFNTYAKEPSVALSPWDWYAFALPALGWGKPGDRFKVDTAHQLGAYRFTKELRASLATMARELDAANVPFRMLVDPRGTDKGFRKLALDAWDAMKQLGHESSQLPDALKEQWEKQLGPKGAATVAESAAPGAAEAAAPKIVATAASAAKASAAAAAAAAEEQLPLPGVPQVMPPPGSKEAREARIQPVEDESSGGGKGSGLGLLLIAAAFMFGRKKQGKRQQR